MAKFEGDFEKLKSVLERHGIEGKWCKGNGCEKFITSGNESNTGILNFWPNKGSYNIQGKGSGKQSLETALMIGLKSDIIIPQVNSSGDTAEVQPSNRVFVVYGHNKEARTQLDAMLRRWRLEPVILDDLPSNGQTIIEKLENYTSGVGFGVVLATADDEGFRKNKEDEKSYRVRQNVILELGMLLVKLGRSRVAILLESKVEMERPSDIQGLIYIPFKDDLQKEAGNSLAKEMLAQGYKLDAKDIV